MIYKIEQNVPLIPSGKWTQLAEQMKIGDSVLVSNDLEAKALKSALVTFYRSKGISIGTAARNQNNGTFRVWRLEPKKKDKTNDK